MDPFRGNLSDLAIFDNKTDEQQVPEGSLRDPAFANSTADFLGFRDPDEHSEVLSPKQTISITQIVSNQTQMQDAWPYDFGDMERHLSAEYMASDDFTTPPGDLDESKQDFKPALDEPQTEYIFELSTSPALSSVIKDEEVESPMRKEAETSSECDEIDFPIECHALQWRTIDEAYAAVKRLDIVAPRDDWREIEENPIPYIQRIMNAFYKDYLRSPPPSCKSDAEWFRYQESNMVSIHRRLDDEDQPELAAWMLFRAVMKTHELGPRKLKELCADAQLTCSARLELIIDALEKYTIFRFDVIRLDRNEAFVANPAHQIKRKIGNFLGNGRKKRKVAAGRATGPMMAGEDEANVVETIEHSDGARPTHKRRRLTAAPATMLPIFQQNPMDIDECEYDLPVPEEGGS